MMKVDIETLLSEFASAWDDRDLDRAVACFAEDAVYSASIGPEPGERAEGLVEIYKLIAKMFTFDKGATTQIGNQIFSNNEVAWTWIYTLPDGTKSLGCDFLKVKNGKIILKDAYRKTKQ